jgi:chromosome segregation ATPase
LEKELEGALQDKQGESTSQAPPTTSTTATTTEAAVAPTTEAAATTTAPDSSTSVEELTKAIKEMEVKENEIKQAKEKLAELDAKYDKSKITVAEQGREIKALKEKIKALEKELNLESTMAEIKRILWAKIDQSITKQWKSIKTIHEQMDLIGHAQTEIQRAKTALGNRPDQANRMIDFLNRQEKEELAAIGIVNRTEAVLTAKKVLTLRNYVQTVERKCYEIQVEVDEYQLKMEALLAKGLPSLLSGAGRLISREQYTNRMATYIENQITASGSTSEETGPPTGQSLYNKLEGLFFIENEVKHLFEIPPNFYRYTEADETLVKIRRHQLPKEDWWQAMLQILPQ